MDQTLIITAAQSRLLASPLRLRILHALADAAATAAEVADALGETRGNVHYHLQKLLDGGLVTVEDTRLQAGHVERCYRAVATRFGRAAAGAGNGPRRLETWVQRTPEEIETLMGALEQLLTSWERLASTNPAGARTWSLAVDITPAVDDPLAEGEATHDPG